MRSWFPLLPAIVLVGAASVSAAEEAFVCRLDALDAAQRERHQKLGRLLRSAVVGKTELENGYAFVLDLGRLPADAAGEAFCVVEVAEWVDLESRCCPFLAFGIELEPKGKAVRLRLTGARGVKAVLESELGLLEKGD